MRTLAMLLVLLLAATTVQARGYVVVGDAYSMASGELLYREYHHYSDDGLQHRVSYVDANGRPLAEKALTYHKGPAVPEFSQRNLLSGSKVQVQWRGEQLAMAYGEAAELEEALLKPRQPLVIDAGFDAFIRQQWQRLAQGDEVAFFFTMPARQTLVELALSKVRCGQDARGDRCFLLQLDNWLFSLLVDPIALEYDTATQRLMRYRGLSNIEDEQGKGLLVDIHYHYDIQTHHQLSACCQQLRF
jgi:hypothetical protein